MKDQTSSIDSKLTELEKENKALEEEKGEADTKNERKAEIEIQAKANKESIDFYGKDKASITTRESKMLGG